MTTQEKINLTWEHCVDRFGERRCIALTLHGSQNYECDTLDSDVDAKLMVMPTMDEIINCWKPMSKTIKGPYGDINVTDIRLFIGNNLHKQNFNFIECLFTKYFVINPRYATIWDLLIHYREEIAHYDPELAVRTMMGQMQNQANRWDRFDNKKTLYHMLRIRYAIGSYVQGKPFAETLAPPPHVKELIREVRLGKIVQEDMKIYAQKAFLDATEAAKLAAEMPKSERANEIMMNIQEKFIRRMLEEELR